MAAIKHAIIKNFTYATTTSTKVGSIPANAVIVNISVLVNTAFDSAPDFLSIGDSSTADKYTNDVNIASVGAATVTRKAASFGVLSSANSTDIYAIVVPGGSSPTAGDLDVVIEYVQK